MGKMRNLVLELETLMWEYRVPHKRLEFIRGLLVYVARNYKEFMHYLKGLHLTIDSWIYGRNKDLYKTKTQPRFRIKVW